MISFFVLTKSLLYLIFITNCISFYLIEIPRIQKLGDSTQTKLGSTSRGQYFVPICIGGLHVVMLPWS